MKRSLQLWLFMLATIAFSLPAYATRSFQVSQSAPPTPVYIDMGTTQTLTYTITNNSTGTNAGERIYQVRFRLNGTCLGTPCTATSFSSSTTAPTNWTRTAFSATSVTFRANTWADAIPATPTPASLNFNLVITGGTSNQDRAETLRDVRAYFSAQTNFGNSHSVTISAQGSWTLKSLQITSFQVTDLSGAPINAVASGGSFRLVMTVKNISTVTQNNIVSNPSPPTRNPSGWTGNFPSCSLTGTNPSPLNLAPGASGTITYTCTTTGSGPNVSNGSIYFSAIAQASSSVTSRSANSSVLAVSPVTVSMAITPTSPNCLFSGNTATFQLTVTNTTSSSITNVTPSALTLTTANGASYSSLSGPTPSPLSCASPATMAAGAICTYTWTATVLGNVTGLPKPAINTSVFVNYNSGGTPLTTPSATDTEDVDDFTVALSPTSTNATSTNQEFTWTVTNYGCGNLINQVAIAIPPGGWNPSGDLYSIVNDNTGNLYNENWTVSGTTFSAPTSSDRIPYTQSGAFSVVFTSVPSVTGTYNFSVTVTDDRSGGGNSTTHVIPVTVNPFPGTSNQTTTDTWREQYH